MRLPLVTLCSPPAGGGGVQRPLKFASHLPALGIETHVLAPDDPKWVHEDADLPLPTQAWIHRARYLGPRSRRLADELHGRSGLDLALRRGASGRAPVPPPGGEGGGDGAGGPQGAPARRGRGSDGGPGTRP